MFRGIYCVLSGALLSRCRVLTLQRLEANDLVLLLDRALNDQEKGLGYLQLCCERSGKF